MNEIQAMYEWIRQLKVGDKVLVRRNKALYAGVVLRLTKTQVVVQAHNYHGEKFRISDGRKVGESGYYYSKILAYSEDTLREHEKRRVEVELRRKYYGVNDMHGLPIEALKEIDALVKHHLNATKEGSHP
jgi:hypothetical protein